MKYTWETTDIKAGIYVGDQSGGLSYIYKIGYIVSAQSKNKYCLISMTDGLVMSFVDMMNLVNYLNGNAFMPITKEVLIDAIKLG